MKRRKLKNVRELAQDYQRSREGVYGSFDVALLRIAVDELDHTICDNISDLLWEEFYDKTGSRWRIRQ